jgi:flagellar motor switch protein FliG
VADIVRSEHPQIIAMVLSFLEADQAAGVRGAADILNYVNGGLEQSTLEEIGLIDPELATKIQDSMFVFDSLAGMDDRSMQVLLREVESELLLVALKGAEEALVEKFLGNMSKRASQMLREDMESQGPVRVSEVEAAQREVLAVARRLSEEGQVTLGGGDDFL